MDRMYTGGILVMDLGTGEATERELDEGLVRSRLGGAALNLSLFEEYRERDPVVIGCGILTGSAVPGCALAVVTARSPVTGRVMHSPLVNYLGTELKLAGFPFIVLHGRCPAPSYLWLHDEIADLLPADKVWGQDTWSTVDFIREEQGEERIQVLSIGPAGERLGTGSTATVDYWCEGDRMGLASRMGGMNLKALAVRGMGELEVEDKVRSWEVALRMLQDSRAKVGGRGGVGSLLPSAEVVDMASVRHRDIACAGCPWPCRTFAKYNEPPTVMKEALKEPGVLICDASGFAALAEGRAAAEAARLLEWCCRLGLEPLAAAAEIRGLDLASAKARLGELATGRYDVASLPQVPGAARPEVFSTFAPNGGDEAEMALAYILGICPRYAARVGLDMGALSQALEAMAGIGMGEEELTALANSIIR